MIVDIPFEILLHLRVILKHCIKQTRMLKLDDDTIKLELKC